MTTVERPLEHGEEAQARGQAVAEATAIGRRRPRPDSEAKVRGTVRYAADRPAVGVLHARPVLSPYAHALIRSVDTTPALATPGVVAVLTAGDLPIARVDDRRMYEPLPRVTHLVPSSDRTPQTWRYTTTAPAATWFDTAFDDGSWQSGPGGFGAADTRFARVGTEWKTPDIWLRRTVDIPAAALAAPHLRIFHDDDARVYLNGVLVADLPGANAGYAYVPLTGPARNALRPGKNTIAIHVHQTRGGQFIDAGIVDVAPPAASR